MLALNSPVWKDLTHAYGSAADIPVLLEQLKSAAPPKNYKSEPWYSLWSALCHQSDVYTASYAALPHIIAIAGSKPVHAQIDFLFLASSIEAIRHIEEAPTIPDFLQEGYLQGIKEAFRLTHACLGVEWQETEAKILLGAMAIFGGHPALGDAISELEQEMECPNCKTVFRTRGYDLFFKKD